jgi:hypothetical protein
VHCATDDQINAMLPAILGSMTKLEYPAITCNVALCYLTFAISPRSAASGLLTNSLLGFNRLLAASPRLSVAGVQFCFCASPTQPWLSCTAIGWTNERDDRPIWKFGFGLDEAPCPIGNAEKDSRS